MPKYVKDTDNGVLVIKCEDIALSEGTARITFWRKIYDRKFPQNIEDPLIAADWLRSGTKTVGIAGTKNIVIAIKAAALFESEIDITENLERFFGEANFDDFELQFYDFSSRSYIKSLSNLQYDDNLASLGDRSDHRFFTYYMKPIDAADLYCRIEFKQHDEKTFRVLAAGILKGSIQGSDKYLYHKSSSVHLTIGNTSANKEYDAERVWNLSFVPISIALLAQLPVKPEVVFNNRDKGWWMPFHDPDLVGASADPYYAFPVGHASEGRVVVAQVDDCTYKDSSNLSRHYLWKRHIDFRYFLELGFDQALGEGEWEFECDDSPFTFQTAELLENASGISDQSDWRPVNLTMDGGIGRGATSQDAKISGNGRFEAYKGTAILLPQCLWGLHDKFEKLVGSSIVVPRFESAFTAFLENFWESIILLCYWYGWRPVVDINHATGKYRIKFKKYDGIENMFETNVPFESTPESFPESENGIRVLHPLAFRNARDQDGFFEDWYASKTTENIDDNAIRRQRNPYTVPATAMNPAEMNACICMGADQNGWTRRIGYRETVPVQNPAKYYGTYIYWYSTFAPDYTDANNATANTNVFDLNARVADLTVTGNFPMNVPLMATRDGIPDGNINVTTQVPIYFAPVIRGKFYSTKPNGTIEEVICTSWRQMLARFYSQYYVKPTGKYTRSYPTLTEFADATEGSKTKGKRHWANVRVLHQTKLLKKPGSDLFEDDPLEFAYAKKVSRSLRNATTTVEYLTGGRVMGDWGDEVEERGDEIGFPPDDPPPPPYDPKPT